MTIKELYEGSLDYINDITIKSYGDVLFSTLETKNPPLAKIALLCAVGNVPVDRYYFAKSEGGGSSLNVVIKDVSISKERILYKHFLTTIEEEILSIREEIENDYKGTI